MTCSRSPKKQLPNTDDLRTLKSLYSWRTQMTARPKEASGSLKIRGHSSHCTWLAIREDRSCRHAAHLFKLGLFRCNCPNQHTEYRFGHDVGHAVSDLLVCCGSRPSKADHFHNVHERIGKPRHCCKVARRRDQTGNSLRPLLAGGRGQANHESVHDIAEWDHGHGPILPTHSKVILDLAWIAQRHHEGTSDAQLPAHARSLLSGQLHHKNQLDEQQR